MSVGSSNSIYDRSRRRCSESGFSWICSDGEVVGVVVGFTVGDDDGHNDAVGEVVVGNSRRKRKWIRMIVQIIVRM